MLKFCLCFFNFIKNFWCGSTQSLLLEEKVSPVRTLVTDVVENITISPVLQSKKETFYRTPHQSQIGFEEPSCDSFSSRRSLLP